MSEPINNPAGQEPTPGAGGEVTFTQAEVDALISKEKARAVAKATKGMPNEEELTAFRAWKDGQQTEKDRWDKLEKENGENKTALAAALSELEQYKREKMLISKGVSPEDVDYYAFKIGKMVTEDKDFEKAMEEYLKESNPANKVKVDLSGPVGGGNNQQTANETMNSLLRGLRK